MNIFLPYEYDVCRSVMTLDDRRLLKQILECRTLLEISLGYRTGYSNHPVAVHYKNYPGFIAFYGYFACVEYTERFNKHHKFEPCFLLFVKWSSNRIPFYAEYPATDPRCIRTTENVSELFQAKLVRKWNTDKIPPKWTNRERPEFYK